MTFGTQNEAMKSNSSIWHSNLGIRVETKMNIPGLENALRNPELEGVMVRLRDGSPKQSFMM